MKHRDTRELELCRSSPYSPRLSMKVTLVLAVGMTEPSVIMGKGAFAHG